MKRLTICCLLFLYLFTTEVIRAQSTPTPSTPSPSDKGSAIGTTVRAALTAAFPGAATLVDSLINAAASRLKLKEAERETAKQAAQKPAEEKRAAAVKAANDELKKLNALAVQLDVVTTFADASAAANQQVLMLRAYLDTHPNPTQAEWTANVASQWAVILRALKDLDAYTDASINARVKDGYINDLLRRIMAVKRNQVERLSKIIKDTPQPENIGLIHQLLGELQPVFSDISRVTTLQVQTLAADLHDVVEQAGEAQSVEAVNKRDAERTRRYEAIKASLEVANPDSQ